MNLKTAFYGMHVYFLYYSVASQRGHYYNYALVTLQVPFPATENFYHAGILKMKKI